MGNGTWDINKNVYLNFINFIISLFHISFVTSYWWYLTPFDCKHPWSDRASKNMTSKNMLYKNSHFISQTMYIQYSIMSCMAKGYFHSTRLMQALRMGLLRLRQNRALGGLLLALLPCFLLLAYCCRFFCANAPTGMVVDAWAGRVGGAGGGAGARAGAGAGVEDGGASGAVGVGSGVSPLALMVRAWLRDGHPAAWICQGRQEG